MSLPDLFRHAYAVANARSYVTAQSANPRPGVFAIVSGEDAIGSIGINPKADIERLSAEIGYRLGEPFGDKGIATQAVNAVCGYAFAELGLVLICATPFE